MAIYYIKPAANGGSDSNNGLSASTAWATLGKALLSGSPIVGGDTVYIAPGTYTESIYITATSPTSEVNIIGNPTATQFPGITPGFVRISSFNSTGSSSVYSGILYGVEKSNYTFQNLHFDGNHLTTSESAVMFIYGLNIKFIKCLFTNSSNASVLNTAMLRITSPWYPMNAVIDRCIFGTTNSNSILLQSENYSTDTSVIKNCLFLAGQIYIDKTKISIINCTIAKGNIGVLQTAATTNGYITIKNCLFLNNGTAIAGTSTSTIEQTYCRFAGNVTNLSNCNASATSQTTGNGGVDFGYSYMHGLGTVFPYNSYPSSQNLSFGQSLNAPTADMFETPWTGANPDTGSLSYKIISNPQYIASDSVVNIRQNTTSRTEFINLNSVGYRFNTATLIASYIKLGGTRTSIPLVNQTVTGSWVSGGFVEIDPVNMPGLYRIDVPDTVFSSSASAIQIINTANSDKATITYKFTQEYKIDLTQAVPQINVPNTVGDALNAARAGTFGGMTIGNKELNYYSPTNAIIKTFTVDSNTYIRSKKEKNFIPYDGLKLYLDAGKGLSYSGSGSNWVDLSGNYNNGFLTNGPTYSSSNEGTIVFDGTNDYISFNTQPLSSTAFTIILNVKFSSFTTHNGASRRLIAINGTGYTGNTFSLFVSNTGQIGYILGNGTGNLEDYTNNVNSPILELNKWYHVCLTFNGTQKKIYIGGNLFATNNSTITFTNPLNNKLLIGSYNGSIGMLQGTIGTVHVYDRALSDAEVLNNYSIYSSRYVSGIITSNLAIYVDPANTLSYSGGSYIYNLAGAQYTGIMINGPIYSSEGQGSIFFDGTNDLLSFNINLNIINEYTVFVFYKYVSGTRTVAGPENWLMGNYGTPDLSYFASGWVSNTGSNNLEWRSYAATGNKITDYWELYKNAILAAGNNAGVNGPTQLNVGGFGPGSELSSMYLGPLLVYNRVLTANEIRSLHENFRGRYGI
jgi:hypothetical protein